MKDSISSPNREQRKHTTGLGAKHKATMTIFYIFFALLCFGRAQAQLRFEFGRVSYDASTLRRKRTVEDEAVVTPAVFDERILRKMEDALEESTIVFSQSMSYSYDQEKDDPELPTARPSTLTSIPSDFPSLAPSLASFEESDDGTVSPVASPSPAPSLTATTVTDVASSEPSPLPPLGSEPNVKSVAFECSDTTGEIVTSDITSDSISVFLLVGYLAESTTSDLEAFLDQLERELVASAIRAALPCSNEPTSGAFVPVQQVFGQTLMAQTVNVGSCTNSIPQATGCFVLETDLIFFLNEDINVDQASFDGYNAIASEMNNNTYVDRGNIPTVVRLEYVGPSNLIPPPPVNGDGQSVDVERGGPSESSIISSREDSSDSPASLSSWTIGASAAAIMGGLLSIAAWSRSRRSIRQRRHLRLLEDVARGPTDGYQGSGHPL